jgi:hypothetical protein
MRDSTRKGCASEMLVAARLVEAGHIVSFPMIVCPYDLIADTGSMLLKVQVKTASMQKAKISPAGRHDRAGFIADLCGNKPARKRYPVDAFDVLAVVCEADIYIIPVKAILFEGQVKRQIFIKPLETMTSQRKDAQQAAERYADFRNNFTLASWPPATRIGESVLT